MDIGHKTNLLLGLKTLHLVTVWAREILHSSKRMWALQQAYRIQGSCGSSSQGCLLMCSNSKSQGFILPYESHDWCLGHLLRLQTQLLFKLTALIVSPGAGLQHGPFLPVGHLFKVCERVFWLFHHSWIWPTWAFHFVFRLFWNPSSLCNHHSFPLYLSKSKVHCTV